ncbi:MAG: NUDIX domain-containing protein [Bacteroidota bacterium]
MINRLNIRVYGLLLNEEQEILVVDEQINDFKFTKFPGGGLELGEGIADCLQREFMEECELAIQVDKHFYTTDFFQVSAFRPTDQLISIYYWVSPQNKPFHINLNTITLNLDGKIEILQFKWIKLADLDENIFTFPIDKLVCSMLKKM